MNVFEKNNGLLEYENSAEFQLENTADKEYAFLQLFKRWIWIVCLSTSVLQVIIFWSLQNLFAVFCVLTAWKLTDTFVLKTYNLRKYTLSTYIIIGFALTQYCLPLIFTLLEGKPLVYNLKLPYEVFVHSILALLTLILSHFIYKNFQKNGVGLRKKMQGILIKGNFFQSPTNAQLWIMGFVGLAGMIATFLTNNLYNVADNERGGIAKFLQGLIPFTYAPFFIPLRSLFGYKSGKLPLFKIFCFTLFLLVIGIGGNSRTLFISGATAAGIAYFLGLLLGKFSYKIFNVKNLIIAVISFWVITGPLSDVGTAMVVVRAQRVDISSSELISKTWEVYQNKDALRIYKLSATQNVSEWDEHYFDNIFLARFCNLKYNDASLEKANKIRGIDPQMLQFSINRFWATLPQPVLTLLQIDLDKNAARGASYGDYLYFRSGGSSSVLGGYRTGQFAGTGMAAFGWWYLLLFAVGIIPVYFLLDLFVFYRNKSQRQSGFTFVSLAGLLSITHIFMFVSYSATSESVVSLYTYILRGWIQMVFLYWVIYYFARKISLFVR